MRLFRSAKPRVLCGATAVAAAAFCFAGACAAQPGGDASTQPAAYHGPYLTWAGKTPSPGPQPDAAPPVAAASPSEFAAWPAPAPGAPRLRSAAYVAPPHAYAPKPAASYVAPPHAYAPKPAASYVAPRRAQAPVAARKPAAVAAYVAPSAPTFQAARPAQVTASAPPAAAAPVLAQNDTAAAAPTANALGQTGVHYYSLHREYGLTPDQVATPKDRPMVLIGPPDDPPTQKSDDASDAADKHGAAESADE